MLDETHPSASRSRLSNTGPQARPEARRRLPWRPRNFVAAGPLDAAIARSQAWCRTWCQRLQDGSGRWLVAIPDVGPSCEVLLADALFHDLSHEERENLLEWIRSQQREDGSWLGPEGERCLSLTCLGYWARVQHGDDPHDESLVKALRIIHELGGPRRANLTVRLWLAMAGTVEWSWVPAVPSELYLLPEYAPLSPARLSPWARQMVTALHLLAQGPARVHIHDAAELLLYNRDDRPIPPRLTSPGLAGDLLQAFDAGIKLARALPRGAFRRRSIARAHRWLVESQQAHGGWFSARPTIYSLMALRASGARSDDPRVRRGLDYLRRARGLVTVGDPGLGQTPRQVLAQGLTARPLAELASLGAASSRSESSARALREHLLAAEITRPGPWQDRADAPCGGWPGEAQAERHLDLRTTCAVVGVLEGARTTATRASLRRAAEVMLAMQESDGSFARFERGEGDVPLSHLPWRDADRLNLGDPDDEGRVVLTARVLRELAGLGWRAEDDRVARAIAWLSEAHVTRGHGWSVSTLAEVVRASVRQCPVDHPLRAACERQLRTRQWEDGSFGDDLSTARALLALVELAAPAGPKASAKRGEDAGPCVQAHRAARHLVGRVEALARERSDEVPRCSDPALPGYGLSPRLCDPSAGVRAIHAALSSFRREVGDLSEES